MASQFGGINHIMNDLAPPFIKVIREANPLSIMISYATVDQVPMSANKKLLQEILRGAIGFQGLMISDALAIRDLYSGSKIAASQFDAALLSLRAGLQHELAPGTATGSFPTLVDAANETDIVALVDEAVLKLLELKFATGTFDLPLPSVQALNKTLRSHVHLEINRNVSREAIVLLQNDGTLPLQKVQVTKVAVLGPFADIINAGSYAASNSSDSSFGDSLRTSLATELGADNVEYVQGVDILDSNSTGIHDAVEAAKAADLAVVALGALSTSTEDPLWKKRTDGEFFTHADLGFPGRQQQLLDAVLDAGVPTILVLSGGQAFVLNNSTLRANAILHSFLGGEYTGDALVEILFGAVNPSGRLPITLPQASGATPINYDYLPSDNLGGPSGVEYPESAWQFPILRRDEPLMKFGFGLSYTNFSYSAPVASKNASSIEVSATVSNTGARDGKEVIQLYFSKQYSMNIERPVRKLIRFSKIELQRGESRKVIFAVALDELGYYLDAEWQFDTGNFTFELGSSSRDEDLKSVNVSSTLR